MTRGPTVPSTSVRTTDRAPELDVQLIRGFRFACRPDCGLCCYAAPRVEPEERTRLLQIAPEAEFLGRRSDQFIASRADGGACQFLEANRCRVHGARPHPCQEFPLTVHVGRRLQASLVLSCPGIDLTALPTLATSGSPPDPSGLGSELDAARERLGPETERRLSATARRGRKVEGALAADGRWQDDHDVRRALGTHLPLPTPGDFPVEDPPSASDGLDRLPLFFDHRPGPLGIARGLGGWEVLEFSAQGGATLVGVIAPPERPPALDEAARILLEGYLRYSLARDAFLASVHLDMLEGEGGTVAEWTADELRVLGATVLARGSVRAKLHGSAGTTLTANDVENGIRATDQDWLDRPSWGERL
jgi:Fe-S-cluster containining protein